MRSIERSCTWKHEAMRKGVKMTIHCGLSTGLSKPPHERLAAVNEEAAKGPDCITIEKKHACVWQSDCRSARVRLMLLLAD